MRKISFILIISISITINMGCYYNASEDNDKRVQNDPDIFETFAAPEHDMSHRGIYKGVLTGSSGNVKVIIDNNNDNQYIAIIKFQGVRYEIPLTETVIGEGTITYIFEQNDIIFTLILSENGDIISSSLEGIDGHEIKVTILKEHSDSQVMCFEGTFSGDNSGIWNVVITGTIVEGYYKSLVANDEGVVTGTYNNGTVEVTSLNQFSDIVYASGSLNGDTISGEWDCQGTHEFLHYWDGTWTSIQTL